MWNSVNTAVLYEYENNSFSIQLNVYLTLTEHRIWVEYNNITFKNIPIFIEIIRNLFGWLFFLNWSIQNILIYI
jgi:hypothetical protein